MDQDAVFKAVADPTRRAILQQLALSGHELTVSEIAGSFDSTRQAITKHLDILDAAGLIRTRRTGRERRCAPDLRGLKCIYDWVTYYEDFWKSTLRKLGEHLDTHPD